MAGQKPEFHKADFKWKEDPPSPIPSDSVTSAKTAAPIDIDNTVSKKQESKKQEPKKQESKKQEPKKQEQKKQEQKKQEPKKQEPESPDGAGSESVVCDPEVPPVPEPECDVPGGAPGVGPGGQSGGSNNDQKREKMKEETELNVQIFFSSISYYNFVKEKGVQAVKSSNPYRVTEPTLHFEESWPSKSYLYEKKCNELIFIDISNEDMELFTSKCTDDAPLMKYVGFAIQRLQTILYRQTLTGCSGNVHCQIISVNPCQKNMAALSALLGRILKDTELYSKFITKVLKQEEFKSAFDWIRAYGWSFFVDYNAAFDPYSARVESDKGHVVRARDMERVLGGQEGMFGGWISKPRRDIWLLNAQDTKKWNDTEQKWEDSKDRYVIDDQWYVVYEGKEYKYEELQEEWRKIVHPNKEELERNVENARAELNRVRTENDAEAERIRQANKERNDALTQAIVEQEIGNLRNNPNFEEKSDEELQVILARKGMVPYTDTKLDPKVADTASLPTDDAHLEKTWFIDGKYVTYDDVKKMVVARHDRFDEARENLQKAKDALEIYNIQDTMFYINAALCVVQAACLAAPVLAIADIGLNVWLRVEENKIYDITKQKFTTKDNVMFGLTLFMDVLALTPYFFKFFNPRVKIKNPDGSVSHVLKDGKTGTQVTKTVKDGKLTSVEHAKNGKIEKVEHFEDGKLNKVEHFENGKLERTEIIENGKVKETVYADRVSVYQQGNKAMVQHTSNGKVKQIDYYENGQLTKTEFYENGNLVKTEESSFTKNINNINDNINEMLNNSEGRVQIMDMRSPEFINARNSVLSQTNKGHVNVIDMNTPEFVNAKNNALNNIQSHRQVTIQGEIASYPNPNASPLQKMDDVMSMMDNLHGSPATKLQVADEQIAAAIKFSRGDFIGLGNMPLYSNIQDYKYMKLMGGWSQMTKQEKALMINGGINSAIGIYNGYMVIHNGVRLTHNNELIPDKDDKAADLYDEIGSDNFNKELEARERQRHDNNLQEFNDEVLPLNSIDPEKIDEESLENLKRMEAEDMNSFDEPYRREIVKDDIAWDARSKQEDAEKAREQALNDGVISPQEQYYLNVADAAAQGSKVKLQNEMYIQQHLDDD